MKTAQPRARGLIAVAVVVLLGAALPATESRPDAPRGPGLRFVENRGAWPARVRFSSVFGGAVVRAGRGELSLELRQRESRRGHALRISFDEPAEPRPVGPGAERFHFILGDEPRAWHRFVRGYGAIEYPSAWHGVDVLLEGTGPGVRWEARAQGESMDGAPRLDIDGHDQVDLLPDGSAILRTGVGDVIWTAPRWRAPADPGSAWRAGRWLAVDGRLEVAPATQGGDNHPMAAASWSTFFGGDAPEFFSDVTTHPDGSVTAGGYTLSMTVPTTPRAFQTGQTTPGEDTGLVTRFSPGGGELIYATFFGGEHPGSDDVRAVHAVDGGGVVIGGRAGSWIGFPTTPGAFSTEHDPFSWDGFVARLSGDGSELVFSTFLGGGAPDPSISGESGHDYVTALDVDSSGNIVVGGITRSTSFPVTPGAVQPELSSPQLFNQDGFVARLSADGSQLLASTYLGAGAPEGVGGEPDWLRALAVMPDDSVVVVGQTASTIYPTTPGVFAPEQFKSFDGFVTRLAPDLSSLVFSSYLGGDGWDKPHDVAIHPDGSILVAGEVTSLGSFSTEYDFPITPDAADPTPGGVAEAFLTQIDPSGQRILYSTFVGGSGREEIPVAVAVDRSGGVTVACRTYSFDAPVTPGALLTSKPSGENDHTGMVARYHPVTRALLHGTYLGGSEWDIGIGGHTLGLLVTPQGDAVLAQGALSPDFPLTDGGAFPEYAGLLDGFVASLTMLPTGVTRYGSASPSDHEGPALGVLAMPTVGATDFGLSSTGGPPDTRGYVLLSHAALDSPLAVAGAQLWLDPARLLAVGRLRSDDLGYAQLRLPIPADPALAGTTVHAQILWPATPVAPARATPAARLVVQP